MNEALAKQAEKLAKRISKRRTGSTAMWELCLVEAYEELTLTEQNREAIARERGR